jgi:co-chaperonin GroES (HSP10)
VILLGNRVLLERIELEDTLSPGGLFYADPWKKGNHIYKVLDVGPGRWLRHPKKNKKVFIQPEVSIGEQVLSSHWFTASEHPTWHQPEYLDYCDGRGRVALDARFCIAHWLQQETPRFIPQSHL